MQFDESGPNMHTRRYWVSASVGIGVDQARRRFALPVVPAGLRGRERGDVRGEHEVPRGRRLAVSERPGARSPRGLH